MTYLVDSSVWLELLLLQERAEDVRAMFGRIPHSRFAISEFSVYSIGVVLTREGVDELNRYQRVIFVESTLAQFGSQRFLAV